MTKQALFISGQGHPFYRIPGLVITSAGTLLAYCEVRDTASDWDAHGVAMRRSADGGATWSSRIDLVDAIPEPVNNPVMIPCADGTIHFLWMTNYRELYHQISRDDGLTFTPPAQIDALEGFRPRYDWTVAATGPGHGIETSGGMLVVPVWMARGKGRDHHPSVASVITSIDGGKTWRCGEILHADQPVFDDPSETAVAERADGSLLFNIRHAGTDRVRYQSVSADGVHLSKPVPVQAQPDPICFGSIASDRGSLYFVNCDDASGRRIRLTVRRSDDGGTTWPASIPVEPGNAGYADLAVADGRIWVLYEKDLVFETEHLAGSLTIACFSADDL